MLGLGGTDSRASAAAFPTKSWIASLRCCAWASRRRRTRIHTGPRYPRLISRQGVFKNFSKFALKSAQSTAPERSGSST